MQFERVTTLDDFEARHGLVVHRSGKKQILVVRVGDAIHALDNRCPHEGYPLSKGTTDAGAGTLTCNWHNWKFRLGDGCAVIGNDNVRVYPTKVEDGAIWIDVTPPSPEELRASILNGLRKGFEKRNFGHIAREMGRLHVHGLDPLDGVRAAVVWGHDRYEYGSTHAYAALADWLTLAAEQKDDPEASLVALSEAIDHMAFDALREQEYPYPAPAGPWHDGAFLMAVEAEDADRACALMHAAWVEGASFADVAPVLARTSLAHYADYGHATIYVHKNGQAAAALADRDVDRALMLNLARSHCYATREDLIPEFRNYAPALERVRAGDGPAIEPPQSPYGVSVDQALAWTVAALRERTPADVHDDLLAACARSLLHYDVAYDNYTDRPVSNNVSWLGFTHYVTFANAVRVLCLEQPELWAQGLLQMACFAGRNSAFLDRDLDESAWEVTDEEAFGRAVREKLLDHGVPLPIFSSHLLKTSFAVFEELPHASPETRRLLLASLNRFLNSPIKGKHIRRLVRQGLDLVGREV